MSEWKYQFEAADHEDWIRQIKKELKGQSPDTVNREWWPGEMLEPFHDAREHDVPFIALAESVFSKAPTITEWIHAGHLTDEQLHSTLLECLEYGAERIILEGILPAAITSGKWMRDIFPEMVEWHFIAPFDDMLLQDDWLEKTKDRSFLRHVNTLHGNTNPVVRQRLPHKNVYAFTAEGNWINSTSQKLQECIDDCKMQLSTGISPEAIMDSIFFQIETTSHFTKTIIQHRVLHLLWNNIAHHFIENGSIPQLQLETHIRPESGMSADSYLIEASSTCLAAYLGGATAVCIHHLPVAEDQLFYKRIDRNIHHLLQLESGFPTMKDPMAGSQAIDFYTHRWTTLIWGKLQW